MPILQTLINAWIRTTGKKLALSDYPWLDGPMAKGPRVGAQFYERFAQEKGWERDTNPGQGLLDEFGRVLGEDDPHQSRVEPRIARFYEQTSRYKLDVWSQWYSFIRWGASLLIKSVSTEIDQLNIPLEPLETSYGMGSEVIKLRNPASGKAIACWLRKSMKTGKVVYAGFYSAEFIPQLNRDCVRVVFPLPNGNVTVILRVEAQPDGSVKLVSHGKGIGEAGYYRVQQAGEGFIRVKYVPLKEIIHVFADQTGTLRTDHEFFFFGIKFLHLHYRIGKAEA